ncbi:MAG TPA: sulfate permease [Mycobacteriales bacterium]
MPGVDAEPGSRVGRAVAGAVPGLHLLLHYDRRWMRPDLLAALSLWAVLVPQSLAYGQLAGLAPVAGLYCALAAMTAYGLLGTSRYLNVGPESSVAVLVAAALVPLAAGDPERYAALAAALAIMVGALLLIGWSIRAGVVTRLLSAPVLTGYLAGSAVVIIITQLPRVTGIPRDEQYPTVLGGLLHNLDQISWRAVVLAAVTALVGLVSGAVSRRLPAPLLALSVSTLLVVVLGWRDAVGVVGSVQSGLPVPGLPDVSVRDVVSLLPDAASIAVLVFAGSVLAARSLAVRDRQDLDANREFVGLGAANIVAGFFQGFPSNGSDSRSFVAANAGGRSQAVGLGGAVLVLVTLLVLTPLFQDVPDAALGAVVIAAAIRLVDVGELRRLWRVRRSDFVLAVVTLAGVLVLGVLGGIAVGVLVSLLEVLRRAVLPHTAVLGHVAGTLSWRDVENYQDAETLPGVVVYRFDAALFFANADVFRDQVRRLITEARHPVRSVVVNAEAVYDIDTTGLAVLGRLLDDLTEAGAALVLARVRTSVRELMRRTGLEERIGAQNFHLTVAEAVAAQAVAGTGAPSLPLPAAE